MKPGDVKSKIYIDSTKENNNNKDSKLKIGDIV